MKNFSFDYYSFLYNTSNTLLKNCGFSPDFRSENDMISLQLKRRRENFERKKIYEAEDKDTFNKIYENENDFNFNFGCNGNSNKSLCDFSAFTTIPSQECLEKKNKNNSEIIKNNNYLIKAYKSKLKKKYSKLYEINSINLEEKNKFKLFHKCCYPGCERTFSSSGWLKAHLDKHLKKIHNSKYCKLFENYLLNEKYEAIQKEEN